MYYYWCGLFLLYARVTITVAFTTYYSHIARPPRTSMQNQEMKLRTKEDIAYSQEQRMV